MKHTHIAIEREYGSGGTKIARSLSKESGIPCYGHEIMEIVSQEHGIPVEQIARYEENATSSLIYSLVAIGRAHSISTDMLTNEGHIFVAEQAVIQRLAQQSPAIFIGHCACVALKDRKDVLRVFIHSDPIEKTKRITMDYGTPQEKVESTMKRFDKKRSNYFYAHTMKKWDAVTNYDLILDSGRIGIDKCVTVLKNLIDSRSKKYE